MVKAWLRDDAIPDPVFPTSSSVPVVLAGDGSGVPAWLSSDAPGASVEVNPTLTVRVRDLSGYDDEGNPEFVWTVAVEAVSTLWTSRQEVDDRSGVTTVVATAVVPYTGARQVTETANVVDSFGFVWRVLKAETYPDRLELSMSRLDDGA